MVQDEGGSPRISVRTLGRRGFVGTGVGLLGWGTAVRAADVEPAVMPVPGLSGDIIVTLLGTGSPTPLPDRFGPSTLIEAGGRRLMFDAGRGAPIRLEQLKIRLGTIDAVFVTHYHSDHIVGLPDLWMSSYLPAGFGGRTQPLRMLGPVGIAHLARNLTTTFSDDIRIRMAESPIPAEATRIDHTEFAADGVVFDEDGIKVTAFEVDHGPEAKPAFGYRVDYAGRSVLISGDTRYNQNLIRHGQGVDLMVHEVCAMPEALQSRPNIRGIMALHTSPEEAAQVFNATRPAFAVFTHIVSLGTPQIPPLSSQDIERMTRKTFDGPLAMGEDLMRFAVGETVTMQRWTPAVNGG